MDMATSTNPLVCEMDAAGAALNRQALRSLVVGQRRQGETGPGRRRVYQAFVGQADETFLVIQHDPAARSFSVSRSVATKVPISRADLLDRHPDSKLPLVAESS